jgi:hypothetical protein
VDELGAIVRVDFFFSVAGVITAVGALVTSGLTWRRVNRIERRLRSRRPGTHSGL